MRMDGVGWRARRFMVERSLTVGVEGRSTRRAIGPSGHNGRMKSSLQQRIVIGLALVVAFSAIVVASLFSGDTTPATVVISGSPADGGGDRSAVGQPVSTIPINPIQRWFPAAGEGSGCSEPVGVDLLPGFGAVLTINGVEIAESDTNVYTDFASRTFSAGGSQGQVTWGPETDCPFGQILRPTGNQVVACVYQIIEGPGACTTIARPDTFDF